MNVKDELAGLSKVEYATDKSPEFTDYTGPFTKPNNVSVIYVKVTDELGNVSVKESTILESDDPSASGLGGATGIEGTAFDNAETYRTSVFNYYLYNAS